MTNQKIILASNSPRRKQLLEWAEIDFDILVRETDESYPPGLDIEQVPVHIAKGKAMAAMSTDLYRKYETGRLVLAADTIVIIDQEIMGKPTNREDAIMMLGRLSGCSHNVITGVVMTDGQKEIAFHEITEVQFHDIPPRAIEYYVDQYKPYDKAGGYAIQEWIGVVGIKHIRGDFYNVMGLPVSRVVGVLINEFS